MAVLSKILGPLGAWALDYLWAKLEARLDTYFEVRNEKAAIGKEAGELYDELDNAASEAERKAVLKKIAAFSDLNKLKRTARL